MNAKFQYAVKVVCGEVHKDKNDDILAPGRYWTAINVHNPPSRAEAEMEKRFTQALPRQEWAGHSKWTGKPLKPGEAIEIDCPEIKGMAKKPAPLVKGFLVIRSNVELDVVAVYAVADPDGRVQSIHTERVPVRQLDRTQQV